MSSNAEAAPGPDGLLRQLKLLQNTARKINSMLDLDQLLDAIVGDVAQAFGQ
jgi:hypothetical protein